MTMKTTKINEQKTHNIDAAEKSLGHVASEAAHVLMGKHEADYVSHKDGNTLVAITNAKELTVTEKKLDQKEYKRYSGYPGGLKQETLRSVWMRRGVDEVIRRAVYGMLPANKLRKARMKRLIVE